MTKRGPDESGDAEPDSPPNVRENDPCPQIPPALLSSEHIEQYVETAQIIKPFDPKRLKSASYEMNTKKIIRWDDKNNLTEQEMKDGGDLIRFPENSIVFAQVDGKFYLPYYIAARFNLRIKHVHRGLLLGTGPLIDPGFYGELLIPVHNLTSDEYVIGKDEGLIWVEFTKTSYGSKWHGSTKRGPGTPAGFREFEEEKTDKPFHYYLGHANNYKPIVSSIPQAVKTASKKAAQAERTTRWFAGIGVVAIAAVSITIFALVVSIVDLVSGYPDQKAFERMEDDIEELQKDIEEIRSAEGDGDRLAPASDAE